MNIVSFLLAVALFATPVYARVSRCENGLISTATVIEPPNLRTRGLSSREAIHRILRYLAVLPGDGIAKFQKWHELIHAYNIAGHAGFIISPCLISADDEFVCWGGTRGNLLVITSDGDVFSGFDPHRADPAAGQDGYHVDWSDGSLYRMLP